jgi:hypothetical protein
MKRFYSIIIFCLVSAQPQSLLAQADNAVAGTVIFSSGANNTVINPTGKSRIAKQGDPVRSGDKLQTDNGHLQVRFTDNGFVSVKPKSQLIISEYAYSGKEDGTERAFFNLLKGSVRAVTGLIGKRNKDTFKYETPVATIGIRGTAFVLTFCNNDCFAGDGSLLPNGLYANNGEGRMYMQSNGGTIDLIRGQFAFVSDIESKPQQIMKPPAIRDLFLDAAENYDFDLRLAEDIVDQIRETGIDQITPIGQVRSLTYVFLGDGFNFVSNSFMLGDSPSNSIITDSSNAVIGFNAEIPNSCILCSFDAGTASLIAGRSGSSASIGATWGIWDSGFIHEDGQSTFTDQKYLAYVGFTAPVSGNNLPTEGTANFVVQLDPTANGAFNIETGDLSSDFTAAIGVDWNNALFVNFDLAATFPDDSSFNVEMGSPTPVTAPSVSLTGEYDDGITGDPQSAFGSANFQFANDANTIGGTFNVSIDGPPVAIGTFLLGNSGEVTPR